MLVIFSAVGNREFVATLDRRQTKSSCSARKVYISGYRSASSYQSQPEFALEGKPIYLQQRLSLTSPVPEKPRRFASSIENKTYACSVGQPVEKKTRDSKVSDKRISGGVRRASIRRRQEQQKPSVEVVYQQKTKRKGRKVSIQRQPLAMSVMSLPGKHIPRYCSCEEATQVTTEEAKATLKRLLASRNHESMMSESVSSKVTRHEAGDKGGLLEKPAYLEDTYDYLFNRHVQTLNGVIKKQEQDKLDEANEINQQRNRKQVIQLCCGGDNSAGEEDASVIIGSTKSSTRQNSSRAGETTNHKSPEHDNDHCNNNHIHPCAAGGGKSVNYHSNSNNNVANEISVNLVTSQIQELELQELEPQKPLIIFNHVPTSNENSPLPIDPEDPKPVVSPPRSRSPTPLLEVPFPVKDLDCEMKRPPIN